MHRGFGCIERNESGVYSTVNYHELLRTRQTDGLTAELVVKEKYEMKENKNDTARTQRSRLEGEIIRGRKKDESVLACEVK